ncbi:MAG: hypothetical protein Fur0043_27510 [Anaerolineales bacterium]
MNTSSLLFAAAGALIVVIGILGFLPAVQRRNDARRGALIVIGIPGVLLAAFALLVVFQGR